MLMVVVALLVATTVAAFSAVIFSLDAVSRASAADRDTVLAEPAAATAPTAHDHNHVASQSNGLVSYAGAAAAGSRLSAAFARVTASSEKMTAEKAATVVATRSATTALSIGWVPSC